MFHQDDGIVVKVEHIVDIPSDEDDDTIKGYLWKHRTFYYIVLDFHNQNLHGEKESSERYRDEDDESFPLLQETDFGCSSGSKSITRQNR